MYNWVIDKREVRSFRLRYRTLILSSFLQEKDSFGIFMFCNILQPKDRQQWSKDFNKRNLKVNYISKNMLKFGLISKKWKEFKLLLKGGVVLIKDKTKKIIKEEHLNFLLIEKKFYFRLLYWQYFGCRSFLMKKWLKKENERIAILKIINFFFLNKKNSLFLKH